eukprot:TRINITY_DN1225_c0_g1_i2.p1 TRINITY_DN1225_c0_g1~~TRINITY_DN1225_c0_g1_i2.p1  ORF type:complete len:179 (+),score=22.64 TRINITY_DN1225_c0_g1_i2:120-656(+)
MEVSETVLSKIARLSKRESVPAFALFYTAGCKFSNRALESMDKFASLFPNHLVVSIDGELYPKSTFKYSVFGYPTLMNLQQSETRRYYFEKGKTMDDIIDWVSSFDEEEQDERKLICIRRTNFSMTPLERIYTKLQPTQKIESIQYSIFELSSNSVLAWISIVYVTFTVSTLVISYFR